MYVVGIDIILKCLGLLSFELASYTGFTLPYTLLIRPMKGNPGHYWIPWNSSS